MITDHSQRLTTGRWEQAVNRAHERVNMLSLEDTLARGNRSPELGRDRPVQPGELIVDDEGRQSVLEVERAVLPGVHYVGQDGGAIRCRIRQHTVRRREEAIRQVGELGQGRGQVLVTTR